MKKLLAVLALAFMVTGCVCANGKKCCPSKTTCCDQKCACCTEGASCCK